MMSNYKKYPNYKDSNVEWLGEIPEHWEVKKLKYNLTLQTDKITITNQQVIALENIASWSGRYIPTDSKYQGDDVEFKEDDVLFGKLRPYLAKVYQCQNSGVAFGDILVYRPTKQTESRFAFYAMISEAFIDIVDGSTYGSKMPRASVDSVSNMPIVIPLFPEQQTIANYLDIATAKIDTLIEKQTKLIALLKEKRQAVISTAVTRGLDSTVAMKDSGVEWLGDIPEGWIVTKIKNMLATPVTDGPHETPEFLDEGVPFVSAEAISKGYINFNKIRGHISQEDNKKYSQKYSPELYDVYMIKSGATTGITAIVNDRVDFNIWSPLAVFRSNTNLEPYYLLNYLRSANFQKAVELYWTYGTQQNIGMNVLENLYISIPPLQEQQAIASHLDDKTSKIDKLITKSTKAIDLLKEKRTALISAVVTGKVDVRGEAA